MAETRLFTTPEILEYLQISRDHLTDLINSHTLKMGEHYFDVRKVGGKRPVYRWDREKMLKLFSIPPRKRLE